MYEAVLVLYMHAHSYSTALEECDRGGDGGDDELAKCGCGKEISWLERCCARVAEGGGRKRCCEWIGSLFHNSIRRVGIGPGRLHVLIWWGERGLLGFIF